MVDTVRGRAPRELQQRAEALERLIEAKLVQRVVKQTEMEASDDEIDRLGKALQTCVFRHAGRMRTTEMIVDLKFAQHGLLKVMCKEAGIELRSKLEPKNVGAPRDRAFC